MRASTWRREAETACHRRAGAGILSVLSGFARSSRLRNLGVRSCTRARPHGLSLALPTVPKVGTAALAPAANLAPAAQSKVWRATGTALLGYRRRRASRALTAGRRLLVNAAATPAPAGLDARHGAGCRSPSMMPVVCQPALPTTPPVARRPTLQSAGWFPHHAPRPTARHPAISGGCPAPAAGISSPHAPAASTDHTKGGQT